MPYSPAHNHALSAQSRTVLLATDSQQSVVAEVTGGKTGSIAYTAYGRQSAQQDIATSLGFNGELRETRVGWYLLGNGYRAYNPTLMRFHSPDSWSPFRGGGLNAYMYCAGDPVNFSDPTGHMPLRLKNLFKRNPIPRTSSTSSVDQLIPSSPPPAGRRTQPLPSIPEQTARPNAGAPVDPNTGENIYGPLPLDRRNWTRPSAPLVPDGMISFTEYSALQSRVGRGSTSSTTPGPPVNRSLKPTRRMNSSQLQSPENADLNPATRPLPFTPDETAQGFSRDSTGEVRVDLQVYSASLRNKK